MRRGGSSSNTSDLFSLLPSAKHIEGMRAKARARNPRAQTALSLTIRSPSPSPSSGVCCYRQASQSAGSSPVALPSIHVGSAPSSPPAAKLPPSQSPAIADAAPSSPGALKHKKQQSPSPTRSSGYIRASKKKAE